MCDDIGYALSSQPISMVTECGCTFSSSFKSGNSFHQNASSFGVRGDDDDNDDDEEALSFSLSIDL